ncbi:MAG: hypothetical protein H6739_18145 [Alphaproteobacteria bacterium]|nr:hypothetical protein [Alphaproteobacteria bacterium]
MPLLLMALLGCTPKTSPADDSAVAVDTSADDSAVDDSGAADDSGAVVDTSDTSIDWDGLHGERPSEPLPLPDFVATSHDGSARGPDDLRGHPTVMWFFPSAGTFG